MTEPRDDAFEVEPTDPASKTQPAEGGVEEVEASPMFEEGPGAGEGGEAADQEG